MFKLLWRIMSAVEVVVATVAVQHALIVAWRMATGRKPPEVPRGPGQRLGEAAGVGDGVTRLVVLRLAAAYYRKNTGRLPKSLREAISEEASYHRAAEVVRTVRTAGSR